MRNEILTIGDLIGHIKQAAKDQGANVDPLNVILMMPGETPVNSVKVRFYIAPGIGCVAAFLDTISAVPATPQSAERATDNRPTGTSSPSFSSDPSEHFRAPENMEELCHLCGEKIAPGSIIVDAQIRGEAAYAHEACIEDREDDMREEGGAL